MSSVPQDLERADYAEEIAEALYMATRGPSVLVWDELPRSTKTEYRARAREALRSCLPYAVDAARVTVAHALASADDHAWDDLGPITRARYRSIATRACVRYRWHLADSAYPEDVERQMGETFARQDGRPLDERVNEMRERSRASRSY